MGLGKTLGRGKAGERPALSVVSEEAVFSVVKGRALTTGALIAMLRGKPQGFRALGVYGKGWRSGFQSFPSSGRALAP